jgi:uncharacterized protein YjhX (UPF0386 family)
MKKRDGVHYAAVEQATLTSLTRRGLATEGRKRMYYITKQGISVLEMHDA